MSGFFNTDASRSYDEKNRRLAPISGAMHFLTGLALKQLPPDARILCVGVGTDLIECPLCAKSGHSAESATSHNVT